MANSVALKSTQDQIAPTWNREIMQPNSLKILHVLDHSLPLHSGYTFRSQNIFRCQRQRGWQPFVVTSPKHEQSWKGTWTDEDEIDSIRFYRTPSPVPSAIPGVTERRIVNAISRRLHEVIRCERPDLIHAHSPILNAFPSLRTGRQLGIPVVYEIRAFWEDAAVDHGTYGDNSWKYRVVKALETRACRKAGHVTVLCQGIRQDLIKRGIPADKLTVVYNGIDPKGFTVQPIDEEYQQSWNLVGKKVIAFIGSFYRYEGIDLLIDAMSHLARKNIVLLLVGGGEMEAELKEQITRLGLQEQVVMPGRIPHDRIPGVYQLADVLAYPRYSMRLTELVTPLKPLEAMAMGKPLVASDIGGHRELIRPDQTGILFKPGDSMALARALESLLDDESLCRRLATQEAEWVRQNHSWEKTTAAYSEVYSRVLGRSV